MTAYRLYLEPSDDVYLNQDRDQRKADAQACADHLEDLRRVYSIGAVGELRIPPESSVGAYLERSTGGSYGASPAASCAEIGSSR